MTLKPDIRCSEGHLWVCTLVDNRCMFCGILESSENAIYDAYMADQLSLEDIMRNPTQLVAPLCPTCGFSLSPVNGTCWNSHCNMFTKRPDGTRVFDLDSTSED